MANQWSEIAAGLLAQQTNPGPDFPIDTRGVPPDGRVLSTLLSTIGGNDPRAHQYGPPGDAGLIGGNDPRAHQHRLPGDVGLPPYNRTGDFPVSQAEAAEFAGTRRMLENEVSRRRAYNASSRVANLMRDVGGGTGALGLEAELASRRGRVGDLETILAGGTLQRNKPNPMLGGGPMPFYYQGADRFPTGEPIVVHHEGQSPGEKLARSMAAADIAEKQRGTRSFFRPENIDEEVLLAARAAFGGDPLSRRDLAERMNTILAAGPGVHEDWDKMVEVRDEYRREVDGRTRSMQRASSDNAFRRKAEENLAKARAARMASPRGQKVIAQNEAKARLEFINSLPPGLATEIQRGVNAVELAEANGADKNMALMMALSAGGFWGLPQEQQKLGLDFMQRMGMFPEVGGEAGPPPAPAQDVNFKQRVNQRLRGMGVKPNPFIGPEHQLGWEKFKESMRGITNWSRRNIPDWINPAAGR